MGFASCQARFAHLPCKCPLGRLPGPFFVTSLVRYYRYVAASEPGQHCAHKDNQEDSQLPNFFGDDKRLDIREEENKEQH